jgi:asparaginyl-tRNA synthetase
VHSFFGERDFIHCHTPIFTSNDCEGGGEAFGIVAPDQSKKEFFNRPVYTTVSSQLHLEFLASSMSQVYTVGPCFRAEPSDSTRHLAEFWMLEAEMAFLTELEPLLDFIEQQIKYCINRVLKTNAEDLAFFNQFIDKDLLDTLKVITSEPFGRITYTDAVEFLLQQNISWTYPVKYGLSLQSEHEKYLAQVLFEKPVFVTHYPMGLKPFYMKTQGSHALCTDLLFPKWGEVAGGSLREDQVGQLEQNMVLAGVVAQDLDWYLDLRRFGSVPHGGYGMGFERLLGVLTGMSNIRDLIPAPRYLGHCKY